MPPRASWSGHIRFSLVSFPVNLFNAISSSGKISFNQLHRKTNRRLKQQMIEPELGPVDKTDIVKGYEYEKDHYVIIDDADLEKVRLETTHVIEILQFADAKELDPLFLDNPYFVAPDGAIADEAFRIFRDALEKRKKIAVGRVVISGREHIVAIRPQDKGFVLTTLRYASEVKSSTAYFEDIKSGKVNAEHLKLAEQLIDSMSEKFDPEQYKDRYQDAMMEIIKAKIEGHEPVVAEEAEVGKVINLMEALKKSLAATPKKPPAKAIKKEPAKKTAKKKRA